MSRVVQTVEEDATPPMSKVDIFNPTDATRVIYTGKGREMVTIEPGQRKRDVALSDAIIAELEERNKQDERSDLICRPAGATSKKEEKEEEEEQRERAADPGRRRISRVRGRPDPEDKPEERRSKKKGGEE